MSLSVFITGGTIDKRYNELSGELELTNTHIDKLLVQSRCTLSIELEVLMLKDSMFLTDHDRHSIYNKCSACDNTSIIVTHGTSTMVETAKYLGKAALAKTIILVGAMIPCKYHESDAQFNLGSAIVAAQCLPHGVYIVMNGIVFNWNNVKKNETLGIFEVL